jgi:hypothetical protein
MSKVTTKKSIKKNRDPRYLSKRDLLRIRNSPDFVKKNAEAREYLSSVDWNEWEKVFEQTEAEVRRRREARQAGQKSS